MCISPARLRLARLCIALLCIALLSVQQVWAGDDASSNADVRYDRTGDGLVDAGDWIRMTEQDRLAYARESLLELGLEPDAAVGEGRTRLQDYLAGLSAVYAR